MWKFFIKATFFVEIFHKDIFWWKSAIKATFLWKFPTRWQQFLWQFLTLGENFVTKQREFWWKFPQNPPNCQNFRAATLPRCKGFCDSGPTLSSFFFYIHQEPFVRQDQTVAFEEKVGEQQKSSVWISYKVTRIRPQFWWTQLV